MINFFDLGEKVVIAKALARAAQKGTIRRLVQGLFHPALLQGYRPDYEMGTEIPNQAGQILLHIQPSVVYNVTA